TPRPQAPPTWPRKVPRRPLPPPARASDPVKFALAWLARTSPRSGRRIRSTDRAAKPMIRLRQTVVRVRSLGQRIRRSRGPQPCGLFKSVATQGRPRQMTSACRGALAKRFRMRHRSPRGQPPRTNRRASPDRLSAGEHMTSRPLLTIVLAAGKGTRMKSSIPKVLHRVGGLSLLGHVLRSVREAGSDRIAVVIGPEMDAVHAEVEARAPGAEVFIQDRQLGTAHAVLAARAAIMGHTGDVLVVFGDTPLLTAGTLISLSSCLDAETAVAVLGFEAADPTGYGRVLCD